MVKPRPTSTVECILEALRPFSQAQYDLIPLKARSKTPAHTGWRDRDYSGFDFRQWLRDGGNIGLRLGPRDMVLDVDPRNARPLSDPLKQLSAATGTDLASAPSIITGGGGRHYFWCIPQGVRVVGKLPRYEGIDIKGFGGFVVAPGSCHPKTGRPYQVDPSSPPICLVDRAPEALLELIRKPAPSPRQAEASVLEPEQLGLLLQALDPAAYGRGSYDKWIRLCAAAHDATGGGAEALEVFAAWCAQDADYPQAYEQIARHWHSFEAGKRGGISCRSLFKAVIDAGRADLVARIRVENDDWLTDALNDLFAEEEEDG